MEKVDNMQKQTDNVSRKTEILRQNQKEILEKNCKEMKEAFDRLISRLDMTRKVISELEEIFFSRFYLFNLEKARKQE